jgi:hypothetical protein
MLTSQRGKINSELGGTGSAATFYEPHMKELVRNPKNQIGVRRPASSSVCRRTSLSIDEFASYLTDLYRMSVVERACQCFTELSVRRRVFYHGIQNPIQEMIVWLAG